VHSIGIKIKLLVFLIPLLNSDLFSQDLPDRYHQGNNYWYSAMKETPFEKAEFPLILEPNADTKTGAYISFPVEYVEGDIFKADIKMIVKKRDPNVVINESNNWNQIISMKEK